MTKEMSYNITCDNCEKKFPKVIRVKEGEAGPSSFEVDCPFCETLLTVQLPKGKNIG